MKCHTYIRRLLAAFAVLAALFVVGQLLFAAVTASRCAPAVCCDSGGEGDEDVPAQQDDQCPHAHCCHISVAVMEGLSSTLLLSPGMAEHEWSEAQMVGEVEPIAIEHPPRLG